MGICMSIQVTKTRETLLIGNGPSSLTTIYVVHSVDGNLQEFRPPTTASQVLADHPTFFLCNSEAMKVDSHVPHVPGDEELEPGQIYFMLPIADLKKLFTLQDLCLLAIQANKAMLKKDEEMKTKDKTVSFSVRRKRIRNARRNNKVDFQLALKRLE